MSQSLMGPDGPGPARQKGSVRAARERAEAGVRIPFQEDDDQEVPSSKFSRSPNARSPTSMQPPPQWPIASGFDGEHSSQRPNNNRNPERMKGGGPNAPRPFHPSQMPPGAGAPRSHPSRPAPAPPRQMAGPPNGLSTWHDRNTPINPIFSGSSRPSTASSSYSLDSTSDHPMSTAASNTPASLQPRRPANLGPPPSARRGNSSYYSQASYVEPILEEKLESPRNRSNTSSSTAPQSWSEGPPTYYTGAKRPSGAPEMSEAPREAEESGESDLEEAPGLVRQASLGKQYKPSLMTVRSASTSSSEVLRGGPPIGDRSPTSQRAHATADGKETADATKLSPRSENTAPKPTTPGSDRSDKGGAFTFLILPSEDSPETHPLKSLEAASLSPQSPRTPPLDPRVQTILGGLEKGGAIERGTTPPTIPSTPVPAPVPRRPRRLDADPTKTNSRGSLASLSDLIRRATRVASNLERGKTASRLGMLDLFNSSAEAADKQDRMLRSISLV